MSEDNSMMSTAPERVWFIGPWKRPGYYLRYSDAPDRSDNWRGEGGSRSAPPDFPWNSMDRAWSATYKPQGTPEMDYGEGWSVLSVADYTVDSRPNVLVAFAVQRPNVSKTEMKVLGWERYPSIWKRLGVPTDNEEAQARVESVCKRLDALGVPGEATHPIRQWAAVTYA